MPLPLPLAIFARICLATLALAFLLVRVCAPDLWRHRAARAALAAFALVVTAGLSAAALGGASLAWPSMLGTLVVVAVALPALLLLPASALLRRLARVAPPADVPRPLVSRRALVGCVAAALPLGAAALSANAVRSARGAPVLRRLPFALPSLPPDLDGLRILQLTDLHLGLDRSLRDLEALLAAAAPARPDLVVITGDLADDVTLVEPAVRLTAQLRPRLGVFAILGNHEYHPGIRRTLRAFDRSPARLLVDASATLPVGASRLALLGVDDPLRSRGAEGFFRERIARAHEGVPGDALRVLLSHRPEGFDAAAALGVDLTLAGHTHGGQVAFRGKALVERAGLSRYPYGRYTRGRSQLYTSAGFGHWFPWRVGCPAEAPLIVLTRPPAA